MAASHPPKVPPGNWIARQLKRINDESHGKVIPKTAASQRAANKYSSMYDVQYSSMNEELLCKFLKEKETDAAERLKMEDARETVGDVFGVKRARKPEEAKMFSNWKIPSRFTEDLDMPFAKTMDSICDETENMQITGRRSADFRSRQENRSPPPRLPKLGHRRSKSTATPGGLDGGRAAMRVNSVSPRRSFSRRASGRPQDPTNVFQPHAVYRAEDLLQKAPLEDRKTIQKVLRMAENKHQDEHAVKQGLHPDVQAPIATWLKGATEKDRAVALDFFKSLSGTKLIGNTTSEQTARLQDIIQSLEGGKEARGLTTPHPGQKSSRSHELHSSLKHLRLLSPKSRKNRWMETTWHHLPEYSQTDPVNNWSSVYTRPHGIIPRHFTIHPEWG